MNVRVVSSQRGDCATGSQVPVGVNDLQDMHNHLREQVDDGLAQLSRNQGHGGLPSGPAGNPQANPDGQAQPDTGVANDLQQQQQSADQTEQDVQQSDSDNGRIELSDTSGYACECQAGYRRNFTSMFSAC